MKVLHNLQARGFAEALQAANSDSGAFRLLYRIPCMWHNNGYGQNTISCFDLGLDIFGADF